jgi:hypothetical protein
MMTMFRTAALIAVVSMLAVAPAGAELRHVEIKTLGMD